MVAAEQAPTPLDVFARALEEKQRARRAAAHSKVWHPSATPATVYQRTRPELASKVNDELASIFEEGNLHQKDVRGELLALGFEVVEAEVNFRDKALEITGTIDGKLEVQDPTARHGHRRIPVEIKSTMGHAPRTADEWRNSESALMRRYYAQIQIYLYLTASPEGLGIFKDKATGLWTVCAVPLDYAFAEALLQRASRIRDAVRLVAEYGDEALPDRLLDRSECNGCPFKDTACHPEEAAIDPLLLVDDAKLVAQLEERETAEPARQRFEKIDKQVKERFKLTKGERFIVGGAGGFVVTKKASEKQTRITIARLETGDTTEQ
jgi:hypothetical protein